ncbi:malate synthase [Amphibacillus sp. MSJ-3]|uniref:malate synthase n=1 Tax=Amphibacillus sp. MSJ-3 TaxID=2841505 RepID=UPI001C0F31C6|nr:malate synthase [Amphibacillus sp. MSJ-3]
MNLINKEITHKVFGQGNIVDHDESFITIDFDDEIKKFVYPDAFGSFITLKDRDVAKSLKKVILQDKKEKAAMEQKHEEKRKQHLLAEQRKNKLKRLKIHEKSQMVFWLDRKEQESIFTNWEVFSGRIQSGKNKGKPNRVTRIQPNSAVLLTERGLEEAETDRRILGLYMVNELFFGDSCEDGVIPSHTNYRIKLTDQEVDQMLFWNYYINRNYPHRTTWNSGKYRYYDNIWTAQILKDMMALKTDQNEIEKINRFLAYFCEMNLIDINDISEPSGALKQL